MEQENEITLVEKSLQGDRDAFNILVKRYSRMVATAGFSKLGNSDELEDLLQETFLRAWLNLAKLRDQSRFKSWLYGIALWVAREKIQQKGKFLPSLDQKFLELEPAPEVKEDESLLRLKNALEKIPPIYQEVVILLYFEKKSYQEMSEILGITTHGVNFRLTKARELIKVYYQREVKNEGDSIS